MHIGAIRKLQ